MSSGCRREADAADCVAKIEMKSWPAAEAKRRRSGEEENGEMKAKRLRNGVASQLKLLSEDIESAACIKHLMASLPVGEKPLHRESLVAPAYI
jgi:hypothetical protein